MRMIDYRLASDIDDFWTGKRPSAEGLCPLLADLDRLLVYLDEQGIKPGRVIDPCPECGHEHRWALLNKLMMNAPAIRDASQSRLLGMVDVSLEPVRALYGGDEGYREMRAAAKEYFNKVGAVNVYEP